MKHKAAIFLLVVGLLQMTGDLLGVAPLKGFGAATTASPAPKVFSSVKGLETYSTRFFLEWKDREGKEHSLELTPEVYSRIGGAYNRRNIYGAALSYGPVLIGDERTRAMFWSVARYGITGDAPILRELGVDPSAIDGPVRVRYEPLPGTHMGDLPKRLEITTR